LTRENPRIKIKVVISDEADLLFYSVYGNEHARFACTKILFTAENVRPDFKECDFAFSFDHLSDQRNYRLPLYAFYDDVTKLLNRRINAREVLNSKKKFCCFVVSNPSCTIRNNFFIDFSKHRRIDSGGNLFNNIGGLVKNKREFIKDYKFVIAFENSSHPGYVTEKIFEPFLENCVPVYWGDPLVHRDFNTQSFINCHDFRSFEAVIQYILEVDADDQKYMQYLDAPVFKNNRLNESVKKENIINRLDDIIRFYKNRSPFTKINQKLRPVYCLTKVQFIKMETRVRPLFRKNATV
jgi:hypothetical protein